MELKDFLLKQRNYFQDNRTEFLDIHFPYTIHMTNERKKVESLLSTYINRIEVLLKQDPIQDPPDFVFIGSTVTVKDLDYNEQDTYTLCFPDDSDPDEQCISFLSPVGQQLLLAERGSELRIETPAGIMNLHVNDIQYQP